MLKQWAMGRLNGGPMLGRLTKRRRMASQGVHDLKIRRTLDSKYIACTGPSTRERGLKVFRGRIAPEPCVVTKARLPNFIRQSVSVLRRISTHGDASCPQVTFLTGSRFLPLLMTAEEKIAAITRIVRYKVALLSLVEIRRILELPDQPEESVEQRLILNKTKRIQYTGSSQKV